MPPVPTPQDGTATPKPATFALIASMSMPRAVELLAERLVVRRKRRDRVAAFSAATSAVVEHRWRLLQRVNACTLPASTLRMLPVDLADTSEAKK